MVNLAIEVGKWLFNRVKQPTSAVSIAMIISYFGIDQAEELSNHIQATLIGLFGIYRMTKRSTGENPDNTFTPMPRNITPLGMELDPDAGVDLSNKENKN